jgi:phosphate/sulfate permease
VMAWVLTLPVTIVLSATLFVLLRWIVQDNSSTN